MQRVPGSETIATEETPWELAVPERREPGSPTFWLVIAALMFAVVPYAFMGESQPRLWNLPLWFHVSWLASLGIAGLSAWRIWRAWRLEDDDG